jgi:hypothetical protein
MRKVGVSYDVTRVLRPELTGLADTMSLKYKKKGDANYTDAGNVFVEDAEGLYVAPITYASKGVYHVVVDSTDARIKQFAGYVEVDEFNIDDVKGLVDGVQADVTAIKAKTDLLNTAELENLSEQITAVDTNLTALTDLVDTVDGGDAITSIRELLLDIQSGGVNVESLVNGQADVKAMLRGDEFLSDGTTPNPLHNKGLDEIYGKVETLLVDVQTAITSAKDSIEGNIASFKASVEGKVDAVKSVIDAHTVTLGDASSGLVKSVNDILTAISEGGNTEIRFDAIDTAISDMQTALTNKLDSMDAKLDILVDRSHDGQILV